jgi:hypothetical protein
MLKLQLRKHKKLKHQLHHQLKKKRKKLQRRRLLPQRKLKRKHQRRLLLKQLRRLRRQMTKSQWTPLLLRLIHPLLPMLPKTLSHKLQSSTTKSPPLMTRKSQPMQTKTHTTQTQWDQ